jgi:hypothetical protein
MTQPQSRNRREELRSNVRSLVAKVDNENRPSDNDQARSIGQLCKAVQSLLELEKAGDTELRAVISTLAVALRELAEQVKIVSAQSRLSDEVLDALARLAGQSEPEGPH